MNKMQPCMDSALILHPGLHVPVSLGVANALLRAGDLGELLPQAPLNAAADPASQSAGSRGLSGGAIAGAPESKSMSCYQCMITAVF